MAIATIVDHSPDYGSYNNLTDLTTHPSSSTTTYFASMPSIEIRRVTSSSDADEADNGTDAAETSFSVNLPDNTSCVSSTGKLSETKPPPKKKSTAAKAKKPKNLNPNSEVNLPWTTNYRIVEKACNVLDHMATMTTTRFSEDDWKSIKENGNNERLAWSQLVGNDKHKCPYLPRGTKVSLCEIVTLVAKDNRADQVEAKKMVKRVSQFLRSSKYDHSHREALPDWKKDLVKKLKVDILK